MSESVDIVAHVDKPTRFGSYWVLNPSDFQHEMKSSHDSLTKDSGLDNEWGAGITRLLKETPASKLLTGVQEVICFGLGEYSYCKVIQGNTTRIGGYSAKQLISPATKRYAMARHIAETLGGNVIVREADPWPHEDELLEITGKVPWYRRELALGAFCETPPFKTNGETSTTTVNGGTILFAFRMESGSLIDALTLDPPPAAVILRKMWNWSSDDEATIDNLLRSKYSRKPTPEEYLQHLVELHMDEMYSRCGKCDQHIELWLRGDSST